MRCVSLLAAGALIVTSGGTVFAQRSPDGRGALTVYAGYTWATLKGDSVPGPTHRFGVIAGASVTWQLAGRFAFQPELQFVQKGDDQVSTYQGGTYTTRIRLNYVEVPLLVRVSGDAIRGITPYVVGGPQFAFKAGCGVDVTGLPGSYTCDDLPAVESSDWGVVVGGGADFTVAGRALTLSARYDRGLKDAFADNEAKTETVVVMLGWRLR
jgi:hypothetical protein